MCRNPKLLIALAVAAILVIATAGPGLGTALPILLVAACPLSMLVMAGGMAGFGRRRTERTGDPEEVERLRAEVAELRQHANR